MSKLPVLLGASGLALLLSSCTMVDAQVYDGGYGSDYVYTVSHYPYATPYRYYNNRYYYNRASYWDNNSYYYGYGVQPNAYWGTYEYYTGY